MRNLNITILFKIYSASKLNKVDILTNLLELASSNDIPNRAINRVLRLSKLSGTIDNILLTVEEIFIESDIEETFLINA